MIRLTTLLLALLLLIPSAYPFCGFFVAKADTKLFNETSQVIMVRNGERLTITMANDFKGDVKDFAMVVPVPVVLKRSDMRSVNRVIFDKLDSYSAPRLAEYYDENPCYVYEVEEELDFAPAMAESVEYNEVRRDSEKRKYGVKIEAKYKVDEYDILILSAKESGGLKDWLIDNGYKIPGAAEEVLEPYIKSGMKFFVVKVDLENKKNEGLTQLNPLQISFNSDKFMLPIRLGMANAVKDQDMVVYTFTKNGRVETTNYRTAKIPTDTEIPLFIQRKFGVFYSDLFKTSYRKYAKKAVFLEYAWDVSPRQRVKCDPCVGPPPLFADLTQVGVDWARNSGERVFFTRLHVRYNRKNFPQDLMFQETPNRENFQGRYVIHHPATGDLSCNQGQNYIAQLNHRRHQEMANLRKLTRWNTDYWNSYLTEYQTAEATPALPSKGSFIDNNPVSRILGIGALLLLIFALGWKIGGVKET